MNVGKNTCVSAITPIGLADTQSGRSPRAELELLRCVTDRWRWGALFGNSFGIMI